MKKPNPQRKSPRLQGYDYRQDGAYFVTICTAHREHRFGEICGSLIHLNAVGEIADQELARIPEYWQTVALDLFVVMPNHIHAIIVIDTPFLSCAMPSTNAPKPDARDAKSDAQKRVPMLGQIVGNYKAGVTRLSRQRLLVEDSAPLWQERYHDHIIRDERGLEYIRHYIIENPTRWQADSLYVP